MIQLLKRHRDQMFQDYEEVKPISIIITTLAARAYNGEFDATLAMKSILTDMDKYIQNTQPKVPNPVNPAEDFADKWHSEKHSHLKLKNNFSRWLIQARADFAAICSKENSQIILEAADRGFAVKLDKNDIDRTLGLSATIITPSRIESSAPEPWFKR